MYPRTSASLSSKRRVENRRRLLPCVAVIRERCYSVRLIDRQVRLRILELRKETVRELGGGSKNVDLIRVYIDPLPLGYTPDVAYFKSAGLPHLPLNTQIPRLRVRLLNVRVHAIQPRATEEREVRSCFGRFENCRGKPVRVR